MSYPFVPAYHRYGTRDGPVRAFLIHMAEGGGTVGYLSRPNANGVSVHYVIERTGRIVQMLSERDVSGSVNPNDIRRSDDADGIYGATACREVMGSWWENPNHALISVEIEGFAKDGPNAMQVGSLRTLVRDVRSRYPRMGLLGHRDFADYKACPGKLIPWAMLGGHGTPEEAVMRSFTYTDAASAGWYTVQGADHLYLNLRRNSLHPIGDGVRKRAFGPVHLTDGGISGPTDLRKTGYLIGQEAAFMLAEDGRWQADQSDATLRAKIEAALR